MNKNTFPYTLNSSKFFVEYERVDQGLVNTGRFRPSDYLPTSSVLYGNFLAVAKGREFKEDLKYQIGFLKYSVEDYEQELSETVIKNALITACENHITKHGRLIDTDLYTYIDINCHIINSITLKSDDELKPIYNKIAKEMIEIFKGSIYVSDPILGLRKLV